MANKRPILMSYGPEWMQIEREVNGEKEYFLVTDHNLISRYSPLCVTVERGIYVGHLGLEFPVTNYFRRYPLKPSAALFKYREPHAIRFSIPGIEFTEFQALRLPTISPPDICDEEATLARTIISLQHDHSLGDKVKGSEGVYTCCRKLPLALNEILDTVPEHILNP